MVEGLLFDCYRRVKPVLVDTASLVPVVNIGFCCSGPRVPMDSLQGGGYLLPDPRNSVHALYLGSRQNQQLSVWSRYLDNMDLNRCV